MEKARNVFCSMFLFFSFIFTFAADSFANPPDYSDSTSAIQGVTASNSSTGEVISPNIISPKKNKKKIIKAKFRRGGLLVKFTTTAIATEQHTLLAEKRANRRKNKNKNRKEKYKHRIPSHALSVLTRRGGGKVDKLFRRKNIKQNSVAARWRTIEIPEGMTDDEAIDLFSNDPGVEIVEKDAEVKALAIPNDELYNYLWGMELISAPLAWDTETGYWPVIIGVIDTGVDYNHPDLVSNMWVNPGEIAGNGVDDDGNGFIDDIHGYDFINKDGDPMDDHYHGTHVAGTIGAEGNNAIGVVGVNWSSQIMALKFLGDQGVGLVSDAISAIDYAVSMGVKITNNSWGCSSPIFSSCNSIALKDAIQAASDAGMLFVAAAGNSSVDNAITPHYPSSFDVPNVLSVAALSTIDILAGFSNYGSTTVDLAAPGTGILSSVPANYCAKRLQQTGYACTFPGYLALSGTSMAAPHVSGAAALLLSANPDLPVAELKSILMDSVDSTSYLSDKVISGGRLNVAKALTYSPISPDFRIGMDSPFQDLISGNSTTVNLTLSAGSSFGGQIDLSVTSPNALISASLNTSVIDLFPGDSVSVMLSISTVNLLPQGYYPIEVTATDTVGNSRSRIFTIRAAGPYINVTPSTMPYISPGQTASIVLDVTSENSYTGDLLISATSMRANENGQIGQLGNFPTGVNVSFVPDHLSFEPGETHQVTMNVSTTAETPKGFNYSVELNFQDEHSSWNPTIPLGLWAEGVDLVNTEIWIDTSAPKNAGSSYTLSLTESNMGVEDAPAHTTTFYLSTDNVIDTNDVVMVNVQIPAIKKANAGYHIHPHISFPDVAPGMYYVGAIMDSDDTVAESNELNNNSEVYQVEVVNEVDLIFSEYTVVTPPLVYPGDIVNITAKVKNQGNAPVDVQKFFVGHYLSEDQKISQTDILIGEKTIERASLSVKPILNPGQEKEVSISYVVTGHNMKSGTYFIGSIADYNEQVVEPDEVNNYAFGGSFTFAQDIDLFVSSVSMNKNIFSSGDRTAIVTANVTNNGGTAASNVSVDYYYSADSIITTEDTFFGRGVIEQIGAGETQSFQIDGNRIEGLGSYYLGAIVDQDNVIAEHVETNNVSDSVSFEIANNIDPTITAISYLPQTISAGQSVVVDFTVANIGATNFTYRQDPGSFIYLSSDTVYSPDDTYLLRVDSSNLLLSGQSADYSATVKMPSSFSSETMYLVVTVKSNYDVNRNNNDMAGPALQTNSQLDFTLSNLAINSPSLNVGQTVDVSYTISNAGTTSASSVSTSFYLSTDNIQSADDALLGDVPTANLAGGENRAISRSIGPIPYGVSAGNYYIVAVADKAEVFAEQNEANNSHSSTVQSINAADIDLSISAITTSANSVARGGSVTIATTVTNSGTSKVPVGYSVDFYMSINSVLSRRRDEKYLGSWQGTLKLANGATETRNLIVTIPPDFNRSYSGGAIIAIIDDGKNISESNEDNNAAFVSQSVFNEYDLVVSNINAPQSYVRVGGFITVDATISNLGKTPVIRGTSTSDYKVAICLSIDPIITSTDYCLYNWSPSGSNLPEGATFTDELTVPIPAWFPTTSATYYLGAIADINNARAETDETNNSLSGNMMTVGAVDADLSIVDVSFSSTTVANREGFLVTSSIKNEGSFTVPAGYKVDLFISTDSFIDASDTYIGSWNTAVALATGEIQTQSTFVITPSPLSLGQYYIGAIADADNKVIETNELNNVKASTAQLKVSDSATDTDLIVTKVSTTSNQVKSGESLSITSTIKNSGMLSVPAGINVQLYLSTDNVIDVNDVAVGSWVTSMALSNNATESRVKLISVPGSSPAGIYYVGAIVDANQNVAESDEFNNSLGSASSVNVTIDSDLAITAVSSSSLDFTVGSSVSINSTLQNSGTTTLPAGQTVGLYLSSDNNFDSNDTFIDNWVSSTELAPTDVEVNNFMITVPANVAIGEYYLFAVADSNQILMEMDETNNKLAATSNVQINGGDIEMVSWNPPTQLASGDSVNIEFSATNSGNRNIGSYWWAFAVYAYLSTDAEFTAEDTNLGATGFGLFVVGSTVNGSISVSIPANLPAGRYYLGFIADIDDGSSWTTPEINENNNILSVFFDVAANVDLSISSVSTLSTSENAGNQIVISSVATNSGPEIVSAGNSVALVLSDDSIIDSNDLPLGNWVTSVDLAAGESESRDIIVLIPASQSAGDYYLGAIADSTAEIIEIDESNNSSASSSLLSVSSDIDLSMTLIGNAPLGIIARGSQLTVNSSLTKSGVSNLPSGTEIGLYLSSDSFIEQTDRRIGSWIIDANLIGDNNQDNSTTITVPNNLLEGNYYVGAIIDETNLIPETNESNNSVSSDTSIEIKNCQVNGADVDCITGAQIETSRDLLCPERTAEPIYGLYCDYKLPSISYSAYRLEHSKAGAGFPALTTFSNAYQMNDNSDVVGQAINSDGELHAVLMKIGDGYFSNHYLTDLGQAGFTSNARAINNIMTVVGGSQEDEFDSSNHEAIWHTQIGMPSLLNTIGGAQGTSTGLARNSFYTEFVSGYTTWDDGTAEADGLEHGFVWSFDGTNQSATVIGGANQPNRATAINDSEYAVGYLLGAANTNHAYYSRHGKITALPDGGNSSQALAINNNVSHKTVGYAVDEFGSKQAVIWQNDQMYTLPILSGAINSVASAISDVGDIVGQSNNRAVLWRNGGLYDLNQMLTNDVGVTLTESIDINRRGRVLVKTDIGSYYILIPN